MTMFRYRVPEGRTLTLPADLTEGTGNTRVQGPATIDIDPARIGVHARFIANRIKMGDLEMILRDPNTTATAGDPAMPPAPIDETAELPPIPPASSPTSATTKPASPAKE